MIDMFKHTLLAEGRGMIWFSDVRSPGRQRLGRAFEKSPPWQHSVEFYTPVGVVKFWRKSFCRHAPMQRYDATVIVQYFSVGRTAVNVLRARQGLQRVMRLRRPPTYKLVSLSHCHISLDGSLGRCAIKKKKSFAYRNWTVANIPAGSRKHELHTETVRGPGKSVGRQKIRTRWNAAASPWTNAYCLPPTPVRH